MQPPTTKTGMIGRLALGRLALEPFSMIAAIGSVPVIKTVAPGLKSALDRYVARHCIAPHLAWYDQRAERWPMLVGNRKEGAAIRQLPAEERALRYAERLDNLGTMVLAGAATQALAQGPINARLGLPRRPHGVFTAAAGADIVARIGAIWTMQQPLAEATESIRQTTASMLSKIGVSEEQADYLVNMELPDIAGMAASIGAMALSYGAHTPPSSTGMG